MLEFLRDQIWNFIAVLIALVVFSVDMILRRVQQKRKDLSYEIVSFNTLISTHHGLDKIQVLYENKPVKNINMIVVQIFNSGNVPILPNDFDRAVTFDFGNRSQILTSEIIYQHPRNLNAELKEITINSNPEIVTQPYHPTNKVVLLPLLLNKGWGVKIQFLVSEFDKINIDGLIVGVQDIRQVTQQAPLSMIFKWGGVGIVAIFLLATMSPILIGFGFTGVGNTLLIGFVVGFIFSGILGLVLGQIRMNWKRVGVTRIK